MITPENIILASSSPRRRSLLIDLIGDDFRTNAAGIQEEKSGFLPEPILRNAERKANAVADADQDALVIGADTGVILDGEWLGKPENHDNAVAMLRKLSGKTHTVITAVSIVMRARDLQMLFMDTSTVTFKTLSDAVIEEYVRLVEPYDMAGGYGIQEYKDLIIERFTGDETNIIGLPMCKLKATLALHDVVFRCDNLESEDG